MATKIPAFSYSGEYSTELKDGYWYIYLKSSGTFRLTYAKRNVDVFLCGGGAGGGNRFQQYGGVGGGGGYITTKYGIGVSDNTDYGVTVGNGGSAGSVGNTSVAFNLTAAGGGTSSDLSAGTGRGGAAGGGAWDTPAIDPKPGNNGQTAFGQGNIYYGAGGGGGTAVWWNNYQAPGGQTGGGAGGIPYGKGSNGVANTGGGGGGAGGGNGEYIDGGAGGSGIVILRSKEDDLLPVFFNGKQLTEIFFNGERLSGLIYGGTRIFARRCKEWLLKRWACKSAFLKATPAM